MLHKLRFGLTVPQTILFYGLLLGTFLLYLCGVGLNQWANPYYAAAVQAGTKSWKAFFYGSFDAGNAITTDKTPLNLWLAGFSARIFGLNYFSIILPNMLAGVASVGLLFGLLRQRLGFTTAWVAAATLALTPVAVAVFRFNDPDALLVFFSLASIAAAMQLNRTGYHRYAWLVGVCLGLGFMTKMLQAFLILPVLGLAYLIFGCPRMGKRLLHLLEAFIGLLLSGGWWVAILALVPAAERPYIGGTNTNSIIELIFGYNGFGRLNGNAGNINGATAGVSVLHPGITRLFGTDVGGQIAWLLPLALIAGVAGICLYWRTRHADTFFFETVVWVGALAVTAVTFSFMQGIFHEYYTVALSPYIAALTGVGVHIARKHWHNNRVRVGSIITLAITGLLASSLMFKTVEYGGLGFLVLLATLIACALLATYPRLHKRRKLTIVMITLVVFGGQLLYDSVTVTTAQLASIPLAGPTVTFPFTTGAGNIAGGTNLTVHDLNPLGTKAGDITTVYKLIATHGTGYIWGAAINNGLAAGNMQLATRLPILEVGGYGAKDPYPTLSTFQHMVEMHQVHYYVLTGITPLSATGQPTQAQRIQIWVREHYAPVIIGGIRVYDLNPTT